MPKPFFTWLVLPPVAIEFLSLPIPDTTSRAVRRFHRWLHEQHLALAKVQLTHVDAFLDAPAANRLAARTRRRYRFGVLRYLEWLQGKGQLDLDAIPMHGHRKPPPEVSVAFLETLEPTLKRTTCLHYKMHLRSFHGWMDANGISLSTLKREDLVSWFRSLKDRNLQPSTRLAATLNVRVYLRWLHEQGVIHAVADELIRSTDLPKLPSYLPRPFPPEADHAMQQRLGRSSSQYELGLLLMRRTGLRLGELISLELNCLRTDLHNNKFLKVPLGKLNNERLVPIDSKTHETIKKLQALGRENKEWLLEKAGRKTSQWKYREVLRKVCVGLETNGRVVSHRLRHTYATSLLSAGMSLVGVMKLLGHKDHRMTLRYAAITQEAVTQEYSNAIASIEAKYPAASHTRNADTNPLRMLSDLNRWLHQNVDRSNPTKRHRLSSLNKRIQRLRKDIEEIAAHRPSS